MFAKRSQSEKIKESNHEIVISGEAETIQTERLSTGYIKKIRLMDLPRTWLFLRLMHDPKRTQEWKNQENVEARRIRPVRSKIQEGNCQHEKITTREHMGVRF